MASGIFCGAVTGDTGGNAVIAPLPNIKSTYLALKDEVC
jgi:hypothetical protein